MGKTSIRVSKSFLGWRIMPVLEVVVIDRDTGRPVGYGVNVIVENKGIHQIAVTDTSGIARFVLPRGRYVIIAGGGAFDIEKRPVTLDKSKRVRITIRRILL